METFLENCEKNPILMNYLPEKPDERKRLPRNFIINVMYTVGGEGVKAWIHGIIAERNRNLVAKQDIGLQLDPAIRQVFEASTSVAVS